MEFTVEAVLSGKAQDFRGEEKSAIAKSRRPGPVRVTQLGLDGDEQADRVHHGGPDMAIHHYPHDHYAFWQAFLGDHALLQRRGAFGENISTDGLNETEARIGDRFRLGTALVEISQGRKPCWKIDHRFQRKGITAEVVRSARCGWYYRVVEEGLVTEGDSLELMERGPEQWSVERVFNLIVAGGHKQDPHAMAQLAALAPLSADWRAKAQALAR